VEESLELDEDERVRVDEAKDEAVDAERGGNHQPTAQTTVARAPRVRLGRLHHTDCPAVLTLSSRAYAAHSAPAPARPSFILSAALAAPTGASHVCKSTCSAVRAHALYKKKTRIAKEYCGSPFPIFLKQNSTCPICLKLDIKWK
jgi:hypothetical protein